MLLAAANADLLTWTIPSNNLIDFCRILVAAIGALHLMFAVVRFLGHQVFWTGIAFMSTGLLTVMQQTEALGDDLVPWRLPLYALMNIAGIIYLYKINHEGREACDVHAGAK